MSLNRKALRALSLDVPLRTSVVTRQYEAMIQKIYEDSIVAARDAGAPEDLLTFFGSIDVDRSLCEDQRVKTAYKTAMSAKDAGAPEEFYVDFVLAPAIRKTMAAVYQGAMLARGALGEPDARTSE